MSIYASTWSVDADDHADGCDRWQPVTRDQAYRTADEGVVQVAFFGDGRCAVLDDTRPCTCAAGPVRYDGSHILPDVDSPRAGSVDLAEIPGWITRTGRPPVDPDETGERVWPWLRLYVVADGHPAVVLLDRDQVTGLHGYLGRWLQRSAGT